MTDLPNNPPRIKTIPRSTTLSQTFVESIRDSPGLKIFKDDWSYPYNVEETRMNTDPFVRKSMKLWNPDLVEGLRGYSKRATLDTALDTLKKFSHVQRRPVTNNKHFNECFASAIQSARTIFRPDIPLTRLSTAFATDSLNTDTAAGFSFPGKKKSEVIDEAYDLASYIQHMTGVHRPVYVPPCKLALRGHLATENDPKSRPVWVFPFEVTILEAKWGLPFYQHLETNCNAVHFGEGSMAKLAALMIRGLHDSCQKTEVTLDWSAFDSSVPNHLIDTAFDIMYNAFDHYTTRHEGRYIPEDDRKRKKNDKLFSWLKYYFKFTKIMLPDGTVVQKNHGIPSGSLFTQAIGSIVNYIVVKTICNMHELQERRLVVLGDDSSFLVPESNAHKIKPKQISEVAWTYFGMTLKVSKLRVATKQTERKFLGYQCIGYRFVRPEMDWFKMVLFPERDVQYLEQSASRVVAYYLLGGMHDPEYTNFYWTYFKHYGAYLTGKSLPLTKGLKRMFKYVLRIQTKGFHIEDILEFDSSSAPYKLSFGDSLYK